ncbi:MAG TPA: damage-inducible protein CinA [Gammaproteobacteria bacterium]|nr:damage-inducible protein CinA [Gammaproteobacteria bacterium]
MNDEACRDLAEPLGAACRARGLVLGTAESCTAGGIAAALTAVAGSSAWFDGGYVSYSNDAKQAMLGVHAGTLARAGAVSAEVVAEMAAGVLGRRPVDWAVAVSGIAGPDGGSPGKPVGLVWFAWMARDAEPELESRVFPGDRAAVRQATVRHALAGLLGRILDP